MTQILPLYFVTEYCTCLLCSSPVCTSQRNSLLTSLPDIPMVVPTLGYESVTPYQLRIQPLPRQKLFPSDLYEMMCHTFHRILCYVISPRLKHAPLSLCALVTAACFYVYDMYYTILYYYINKSCAPFVLMQFSLQEMRIAIVHTWSLTQFCLHSRWDLFTLVSCFYLKRNQTGSMLHASAFWLAVW